MGMGDLEVNGFSRWLSGKESACQCRRCGFNPWVRKISWRRECQPTPVFLPGKSYGQRSLVGYSHGVAKESDTTERLSNNKEINALGFVTEFEGEAVSKWLSFWLQWVGIMWAPRISRLCELCWGYHGDFHLKVSSECFVLELRREFWAENVDLGDLSLKEMEVKLSSWNRCEWHWIGQFLYC